MAKKMNKRTGPPPVPVGFPPPPRAPGQGITATTSSGAPLSWGNPKSEPAYGHSFKEHGAQRDAQSLRDRAVAKGDPQGHWEHNDLIVEAEQRAPLNPGPNTKNPGEHIVDMGRPIGTVYHPDGREEVVTRCIVVRDADNTVVTSYPIPAGRT